MPCEIDTEHIDVSFKDGVLKIKLPKTEAAREQVKKFRLMLPEICVG